MANIFEFVEIQYNKLSDQITQYLQSAYSKTNMTFSSASPYGQILDVQKKFFQNMILYIKQAVANLDITQTNDVGTIRALARISGHNPTRSVSAKGTLKFQIKPGTDILDTVKGGQIVINNNTLIKNLTNNLNYTIKLGGSADSLIFPVGPNCIFYVNVVQGKYETQTYTGDGTIDQSIQVNTVRGSNIDNFDFTIKYNGIELTQREHMYDMLPSELACYTKTGMKSGMDIFFGNSNFGFIPQPSTIITVQYLLTNGTQGNVINKESVKFKFIDIVKDGQGNELKMEDIFDVYVDTELNFASDGESVQFTKAVVPYVSRNFVLATANQFIYHLKRLNLFSAVNAFNTKDVDVEMLKSLIPLPKLQETLTEAENKSIYDTALKSCQLSCKNAGRGMNACMGSCMSGNIKDLTAKMISKKTEATQLSVITDNTIILYLIPRIDQFIAGDINYFNIPEDAFYLDDYEKSRTEEYLKKLGILSISTSMYIIQPKMSKYIMNVHVRRFNDAIEDNIKQDIVTLASDYFIKNTRTDRIIKSDIIKEIKNKVNGIDSVDLDFVSQENEDYHKSANSDPNTIKGLDLMQGDILIENNKIVLLRGGWSDRNGIMYKDNISNDSCTINILFDGVTQRTITK